MSSRRLSVCFLGAATSPHVLARAAAFVRLGHEVVLISPVRPISLVPEGVEIKFSRHYPNPGFFGRVLQLAKLIELIVLQRSDVYFAHFASEITTWAAAFLFKRPFAINVMGGDVLFGDQGRTRWYNRFLTIRSVRSADLVVAKSEQLVQVLRGLNVRQDRILKIYWGVERSIFLPRPECSTECRASWGVDPSKFLIFSPRLLQPLYNQQVMIEALPRVIPCVPHAVLALSTFGSDESYRAMLVERARLLGVLENVVFVDGRERLEMPIAYSAADVVLSVPRSDGFPQSVLEAMACRVPVVMSDLPHFHELIQDGEHALMVKVDAESIAGAVVRLYREDGLAKTLVGKAAQLVSECADIDVAAEGVEARLFGLLDMD